jgi:DinB superfamily
MSTTEEIVAAIEQAGEDYARFIEAQSPEAFHRRPAPEEWTAAELTGHVAEFPVTFSEQARRVSESPGLQLGRSLDDPGRLAAVEKLAGAGPVEAAAAVRGGIRQAADSLRGISEAGWQAKGQHPRLGEISAREVVEHFILDHLREHLKQARAAVGA